MSCGKCVFRLKETAIENDFNLAKQKVPKQEKRIPKKHPQYDNVQPPPHFDGNELVWKDRPRRPISSRHLAPMEKPGAKNFTYKTSPGEMFEKFFADAGEFWRKQSNKKLKELTELHNRKHPQHKRRLYQITKNDCKAVVACILHMGSNKKSNFATYWSSDPAKNDPFILKIAKYSNMSARRFRKILNCIRLYDKAEAEKLGLSKKTSETFDEHYKVKHSTFIFFTHFNTSGKWTDSKPVVYKVSNIKLFHISQLVIICCWRFYT